VHAVVFILITGKLYIIMFYLLLNIN